MERPHSGAAGQPSTPTGNRAVTALRDAAIRRPRVAALILATVSASFAGLVAGPVAAVVAAAYALTGAVVFASRRRDAADAVAFRAALADVAAAAADLRAGADPITALGDSGWRGPSARSPHRDGHVLHGRVSAAVHVAEETGAPLADLLERLERDGRALAQARASAVTQAAGAEATAWLLAVLPVAGIALGQGVGADPVHVLLHTPIGATCACGAIVCQVGGLAWVRRLARSIVESA
ncbi:MAG TPA: hypothetical protein VKB59_08000 [Micromonosporaceae bacterium]|nr:hypothetical protein [Micromonosporaceae bacterium]